MAGLSPKTRFRARALGAVFVSLLAVGLTCAAASAAGGSGVIDVKGKIGPLQINKSTRADVVALAGPPDAEIFERVLGFPAYDALGYDCQDTENALNFTLGNSGPYCRTVFFLESAHRTLEDFFTTSASYRVAGGVRIGTSASQVAKILHGQVSHRCNVVLRIQSGSASLRVAFAGGKANTFVVHSLIRTSGLFNCTA